MKLVIVESPTKAKTISKFLSKEFRVESSYGHIRDLPKKSLGVDVRNNFLPQYEVSKDREKILSILLPLSKKAEKIILASDEDREGEAIAWHLLFALNIPKEKIQRIVFHEITKNAILKALEHPRDLDTHLIDAQQARRVLDRLVGYELSPLLWKKIARGLSAGRVQSVAVRLIVEREREIQAFQIEEYWTIDALFQKKNDPLEFPGKLVRVDEVTLEKFSFQEKKQAEEIVKSLKSSSFFVENISKKDVIRNPQPPFTTSTLQQEANKKLGFSSKLTMKIAQELYEGIDLGAEGQVGLITYMRTDSVNLSEDFLHQCETFLREKYGKEYTAGIKKYQTKSKGAQEAHEAIRPANVDLSPDVIKTYLSLAQWKLYNLIWRRAVASQASSARLEQTSLDILSEAENKKFVFRSSGSIIRFDGFLKIYTTSLKEQILPTLVKGDSLDLLHLDGTQHFTEPPARFSDASLVKSLEEYGIGRPSTYAPTISTIIDRGYVRREEKHFIPTDIAFVVNDLLVKHFPQIVDYSFTAKMEENLDEIASGEKEWQPIIQEFYFPFHENLILKEKTLDKKELTEEETNEVCEKCGSKMIIRIGKFGKFLACSKYPECKNTKPLPGSEEAKEKSAALETNEICEKCGKSMVVKRGRFGSFLGCSGYPDCKNIKSLQKKLGIKCPKCGIGEMVEKKSKRGKPFYACDQYPKCENAYWSKPIAENGQMKLCPKCQSVLVYGPKETIRCSEKGCGYKETQENLT